MFTNIWDLIVLGLGLGFSALLYFFYRSTRSRGLLNYIPTVWTSLGILGTFVAIYVSLTSVNFKDIVAVGVLVEKVAPAFTTSIIGIIGAVISSIAIKIIFAFADRNEKESDTGSLIRTIEDMESHLASMRGGVKIVVNEAAQELFNAVAQPLTQAVNAHINAIESNLEQEKIVLESVRKELLEGMRTVFQENVAAMSRANADMRTAIAASADDFRLAAAAVSRDIAAELKSVSDVFESHKGEIADIVRRSLQGGTDGIINALETGVERHRALIESMEQMVERISSASTTVAENHAGIEDLLNLLNMMTDRLTGEVAAVSDRLARIEPPKQTS